MPENPHNPHSSNLPPYPGTNLEASEPEEAASFGERVSAHLESSRFKRQFNRIGATVAAGMLVATGVVVHDTMSDAKQASDMATADYAPESPSLQYGVVNAPEGVYSRNSPHTEDTPRIAGQGVYNGDTVQLLCGVTNGDAVGKNDNNTWHKVKNLTRPEQPDFWLNDYHIASPNVADQLVPGEPVCVGESESSQSLQGGSANSNELQNAGSIPSGRPQRPPTEFRDGGSVFYAPENITTSPATYTMVKRTKRAGFLGRRGVFDR